MTNPYCKEQDLLIGDITLSTSLSKSSFVRDAADEIDSRLGFVYVLPLPMTLLQAHAVIFLKQINARLASGRLLMSIAAPAEENSVHRYGEWLIKSAFDDLYSLCNRSVDLVGAVPITDPTPNVAAIYNHDEESAVTMFEEAFMRQQNVPGQSVWWQPGQVS